MHVTNCSNKVVIYRININYLVISFSTRHCKILVILIKQISWEKKLENLQIREIICLCQSCLRHMGIDHTGGNFLKVANAANTPRIQGGVNNQGTLKQSASHFPFSLPPDFEPFSSYITIRKSFISTRISSIMKGWMGLGGPNRGLL